jgi:hypothetical protein
MPRLNVAVLVLTFAWARAYGNSLNGETGAAWQWKVMSPLKTQTEKPE